MKKLTKVLILVLSVALLAGAFILSASAEEKSYEFDETNNAFLVYADEATFKADKQAGKYTNKIGEYNTIEDAVAACKSKDANGETIYVAKYIALQADWERGTLDMPKGTSSISLNVPGMTIDLNGYTMSFSVYSGYVKADGTRATAYTWLGIGTSQGVTIVGNGGAIEATMSIFQHTGAGALNLVGGEGGLTLRAITGMTKKVSGSWTNDQLAANTDYSGGQIVKLGANNFSSNPSTSILNVSGKVTFERANTKTISAIGYWGATKVNIGTKDGERSTVSYIDKTGTPGIGTQYNNGEGTAFLQLGTDDKFDSGTQDIYATKAVSSSCNIVNTDIKLHLENFFYSEVNFYKLADPKYNDDQQYLRIENSTIVGDGFASDFTDYKGQKDNIPEKLFYSERISPVCIDIVESRIETYTRTFTFAYDNKSSSKVSFGYVHAVDSVFIGAKADGTKGYPLFQSVGTALFENCSIFLGESVCSGGSPWLPYGQKFADGSDPVWPVFSEELGGAGILIDSGCIFLDGSATSYGNTAGSKNADGTWKQKPAKDHPGQNDTGYGQNTCVNINGYKTITVYDLKTNKKGVMVTDDTKKVNHITTLTGINTFNSGVVGTVYKDGTAPSFGESLSWVVTASGNPRCGMLTVNASKTFDNETGKFIESTDNKYITHNYWADTEGKTYAQDYYGYTNAPAFNAGDKNPPVYDIRDSGFYSVDFDLMTTEDEFTGMYVTLYIATVVGGSKQSDMIRLDLRRDGTLESNGIGQGKYKIDFTPGVWQHITAVLEMPTVEVEGKKVVDTANVTAKSKLHLYIDGVLVYTYDQPLPNGNVEKADNLDYCGLNDVRLGFQSSTSKNMYGERNTSIDNFSAARYPVSSTLKEASTYMLEAQKALGIEQPEDVPFVTFNGYQGYETAGQNYVESLISNGILDMADEEIELHTDYKGIVDLDEMMQLLEFGDDFKTVLEDFGVEEFRISFKTNGYEINFAPNDYAVVEYDEKTDIYTLRNVLESDMISIIFDDLDDATENVVIKVLPNRTLSAEDFPKYDAKVTELAYAKITVAGWATEKYGAPLTELEVGEEEITLYPAVKTTAINLELLFNVRANDNITTVFYIPAELLDDTLGDEDTIPGFRFATNDEGTGIVTRYSYDSTTLGKYTVKNSRLVSIEGYGDYYSFDLWPAMQYFSVDMALVLDYFVEFEGVEVPVSAHYSICALDYCEYVLDNEAAYTDTERAVAANFMRYGYEFLNALAAFNPSSTVYPERAAVIKASYDKYLASDAELFTEYEADLLKAKDTDASDIAGFADISLIVSGDRMQFNLAFANADVKVKKVTIKTIGWAATEELEDGTVLASPEAIYLIGEQTQNSKKDENGYYTQYRTQNAVPYNMFGIFEITFVVDELDVDGLETESEYTGYFSLADYYQQLVAEEKASAPVFANLFYALKEYGDAVVANRFVER